MGHRSDSRRALIVAFIGAVQITIALGAVGDGGSKCPDATCTPAPPGVKCEAKYADNTACCPTWVCSNGQQFFGMNRASGFSSFASTGFGNMPFGLGANNGLLGNNPLFGGGANNILGNNNNPFANLFGGNLFGGRRR